MRAWLSLWFVVSALGFAADAEAFECTRSDSRCIVSLQWKQRELPYVLRHPPGSKFSEVEASRATDGAFERWASVACSDMRFTRVAILPPGPVHQVSNQVDFVDVDWELDYDASAAAVTTVAYGVSTGTIRTATIAVNEFVTTTSSACSFEFDLETVITHEVGHFIGLAHPCETAETLEPDAPCPVVMCADLLASVDDEEPVPTMWPIVNPCDRQLASLESDDTQALCFVYPRARPAQQCSAIPVGGDVLVTNKPFGCSSTGRGSGAGWLVVIAAWIARRRR